MQTFADGDKYEGEFVDNKFEGRGVYTMANGTKLDGPWKNGELNGVINIQAKDGEARIEEWNNGVRVQQV